MVMDPRDRGAWREIVRRAQALQLNREAGRGAVLVGRRKSFYRKDDVCSNWVHFCRCIAYAQDGSRKCPSFENVFV